MPSTANPSRVSAATIKAGLTYVIAVFAVAFLLGAIRVLIVIPRLGETLAVLLETPILLVISWQVSQWCVRVFRVGPTTAERAWMGAIAFAVLMLAEFSLSNAIFERTPADYVKTFLSPAGAIGLAAQVGFAFIPWIQARMPRSGSD